jgi:hypothetical protein
LTGSSSSPPAPLASAATSEREELILEPPIGPLLWKMALLP